MSKFTVPEHVLYICTGSKCGKRGGKDLYKMVTKGWDKMTGIEVVRTECTDRCDYAPVCAFQPGNVWLKEYRVKQVLAMMEELARQKV